MSHSNFYVYKIWSLKGDKVYYGSTATKRRPIQRYHQHKAQYKGNYLSCTSKILFDEYGVENCMFQLIEECKTEEELRLREKWYILNNTCVNIMTPSIVPEEVKENKKKYMLDHKEDKKEYDKLYREKNADERKEKIKCECGGSYVKRHKTTHEKTQKHLNLINKNNTSDIINS